ncbi:hypothetical protein SAMN02745165_01740 [Malonomonas rubra DSM 5091]|uniref:Uncharacterized protein n=1 Tax=Malonomonas rubra DSM 5091 TaxID=1122189 RepID=A0A1M6H9F7_MALRU|nr:hypothetical protein [Malonomonas rubra]SHJ18729.1 hypothetical protein SAMN02745165_01740 [Malonomonas rubra DSM 5091]
MKIIHRISLTVTPEIQKELKKMNIDVEQGFDAFEIDETNSCWLDLEEKVESWKAVDTVSTKFTKEEMAGAKWLRMISEWHHGYPQPNENEFGYLKVTYDSEKMCEKCGIGAFQKSPFVFKKDPTWGKRSILQVNWVFDEFFAKPELWDEIFKEFGVGHREVFDRNNKKLSSVLQLEIKDKIDIRIDNGGEICCQCGQLRLPPTIKGFFPAACGDFDTHIAKTNIYFGSGASSYRAVVVSSDLYKAISSKKVKGVKFHPLG